MRGTKRRGFAIEFTSLARARMSPAERAEVFEWANARKARVYIWYRGIEGRWEAVISLRGRDVARQSSESPFEAFIAAAKAWDAPAVMSLLTGPAA